MKTTDLKKKTKEIALIDEQLSHLRARNRELEGQVARLFRSVGEQREMGQLVAAAVKAADPFARVPWGKPAKAGKPIIPVFMFSDWHIGEVVQPDETEGFGLFNWTVAQKRALGLARAFVRWVETQRHGYRIDECVILGIGDYISGDIHRELSVTAEFPVPVQTARAGLLLGETIATIAPHFGHVRFHQVGADNHGRLNPKPQFKQKAENSYSYLVHTIAAQYLEKHKNVECLPAKGIKEVVNVAGWSFLVEHGDNVKGWMGIPYYGLERHRAREATRRMNSERPFDYQTFGHWHVPALISGNIIVNGSLSGTNEFDHGCGRHSPAAQVAFMVHPEHGLFNLVPFQA